MGMEELKVGLVSEAAYDVTPERTAKVIGSGTLDVFGTPAMAALVEKICLQMVDPILPEGQTTVGSQIDVHHLAPTPVGDRVRLRAEIVSVEKNMIDFDVNIWDSVELVGTARHQRVILNVDRFLKRVHAKPP
jgi:fluoroacetyl-CoA thioesterase